jgi:enoyl-CoA hydratase/carnithine racemase
MMGTLVAAVGKARAKELIYTARVVQAEEAREIGLVQAVVRRALNLKLTGLTQNLGQL